MPSLLFFFLLFSSVLMCCGQNNMIKAQAIPVSNQKKSTANGNPISKAYTGRTNHKEEKVVRPFYINTLISPTDSLEENRLIKIIGGNLSEEGFRFEVRNRWGNFVYESRSLNEMMLIGWDGTQDGTLLREGHYSFSVMYKDNNGNSFEKKGFITIDP